MQFEQGNEKDDGDPYVCFRRREVRNVRKTRRTDTQSTDKLKRLRQELETARGLIKDVWQRETMRKNTFEYERQIFEKRRALVDIKRKYQIKDTDEDLITKVRHPTSKSSKTLANFVTSPRELDPIRALHQLFEYHCGKTGNRQRQISSSWHMSLRRKTSGGENGLCSFEEQGTSRMLWILQMYVQLNHCWLFSC